MKDTSHLQTLRDWLRFACSRFREAGLYYGHGTDNAWDEALALILHALFLPMDLHPPMLDARLTDEECKKVARLIVRRVEERIPVPYLNQEAWFAGLSFYVDERVLIPRSSLGELIQNQFEPWIQPDNIHRVLDLCTGSGCIAIAIAEAYPAAQIDASDLSEEALAVAKINLSRHQKEDQITLYQSDVFTGLPSQKYDLIISNPPYVDAEDMAALPPEYRHEPALGLAAGSDGLDIAVKILQQAANWLTPEGHLIVEVGNSEAALAEKYPEIPFTWLDFEHGEGGVFMLTAADLRQSPGRPQVATVSQSES